MCSGFKHLGSLVPCLHHIRRMISADGDLGLRAIGVAVVVREKRGLEGHGLVTEQPSKRPTTLDVCRKQHKTLGSECFG